MLTGYAKRVYTPVRKVPGRPGCYFNEFHYVLLRIKPGLFVLEHRYIVERVLGRKLRRDEEVNHINGVKSDNRNTNLFVCSREYHHAWHERCHRRYGTWHPPVVGDPATVSRRAFEAGCPISSVELGVQGGRPVRGSDTVTRKSTGRPVVKHTREDIASIFRQALGLW